MVNRIKALLTITGEHLKRHSVLLLVYLGIIFLGDIFFTLSWYFSPDDVSMAAEVTFYVIQTIMFILVITAFIFMLLVKAGKFKDITLAVMCHIFAFFLIAWGTTVFCLDSTLGFSPLTYLIIATFVSAILIIDPFYFAALEVLSLIPILITIFCVPDIFFGGEYLWENIILFVCFVFLTVIICFRNYRVIYQSYEIQKKLEELSYLDGLTGLLNERSYIETIEKLDKMIDAGEDVPFAVVLMDVNNLKATNDQYGHRFGCSLVVRSGQTLPHIFPTSKVFHVGGDEFIAIVQNEDYRDFEKTMQRFDEAMLYSLVTYEGVELIFSVARGYHVREKGEHFKDALQIADKAMYENKKMLKEKYNMKGR